MDDVTAHNGLTVYKGQSSTGNYNGLNWRGASDFRFKRDAPKDHLLCGVRIGSNNWGSRGVSSMQVRWCNVDTWSNQISQDMYQDQDSINHGGNPPDVIEMCDNDCDQNSHCAGDLVCHQKGSNDSQDVLGCKNEALGQANDKNRDFCVYAS
jgi:hypothetical protein